LNVETGLTDPRDAHVRRALRPGGRGQNKQQQRQMETSVHHWELLSGLTGCCGFTVCRYCAKQWYSAGSLYSAQRAPGNNPTKAEK
jgi:hypothetical protein